MKRYLGRSFLLGAALAGLTMASLSVKGSESYEEEPITTKRRNGWRTRRSSEKGRIPRRHKRWATWAVRDQPDYHNEEPHAGRATMREGTNGVTYSARKVTM